MRIRPLYLRLWLPILSIGFGTIPAADVSAVGRLADALASGQEPVVEIRGVHELGVRTEAPLARLRLIDENRWRAIDVAVLDPGIGFGR